jgi:hypothetical protein
MKYFLLFLFCLSLQSVVAQDENRHAAAKQPMDTAALAARRFEGRLERLREALDKNNTSAMTAEYANLLGDIRSCIGWMETKELGSQRLASMNNIFAKVENFIFDPARPAELRPCLASFEEFLKLLKEK